MAKGNEIVAWVKRVVDNIRAGKDLEKCCEHVGVLSRWAVVATRLWTMMPGGTVDGVKITKVSIYPAPRSPGMVMLCVSGTRKKESLITFYTGEPGAELFDGFQQKARDKGLKWKVDTPYEGKAEETEVESLPAIGGR